MTSYTRQEKLFLLFAMICSFCITSEYAITKPTSNSIFLAHYSSAWLPYAWLATVPLNLIAVSYYNRFVQRLGSLQICLCFIGVTISINLLSAFYASDIASLPFILYVWKDIYVLLMFQQLWSVIHSVIKAPRAKYLYGLIFGVGGVGAILGSLVPSFFAVAVGSQHLLVMTAPIYLLFIFAYYFLLKGSGFLVRGEEKKDLLEGFRLIRDSRSLKFILLIVILMQVMATVMDFQFNTFLVKTFPDQDVRTQFSGRLFGAINTLNLCLQFFATFLIVHLLGLRRSHFLVPVILLANTIGCLLYPGFLLVTYSFAMIKTFDYSIFNIIKEMLYVPLKKEEKFTAKAIIDVFAYRCAKACASLFVIGLQFFLPEQLPYAFTWIPFMLALTWLGSVYFLMKEKSFATRTSLRI